MVDFAIETYDQIIDELKPLLPLHYEELAVNKDIPLDPDFDFYRIANASGILVIYSARIDGVLVGYAIFVVRRHPHYRFHSWASNDVVWLHPDHRQIGIGRRFADFWDADLQNRGVHVVHINAKVKEPALMYLLKDRGYATTECGLEKRLN